MVFDLFLLEVIKRDLKGKNYFNPSGKQIMARTSFQNIKSLKKRNIGIVAITAYDASFAKYFDNLGFDIILIGDSLGQVIKGQKNTHNVSLENMIYHSQAVRRAVKNSYLISDLPRESSLNKLTAYKHAKKIISECKVNMIKIECNKSNYKWY